MNEKRRLRWSAACAWTALLIACGSKVDFGGTEVTSPNGTVTAGAGSIDFGTGSATVGGVSVTNKDPNNKNIAQICHVIYDDHNHNGKRDTTDPPGIEPPIFAVWASFDPPVSSATCTGGTIHFGSGQALVEEITCTSTSGTEVGKLQRTCP
jgi:hypothetical protein